jgi:hypothetical protein
MLQRSLQHTLSVQNPLKHTASELHAVPVTSLHVPTCCPDGISHSALEAQLSLEVQEELHMPAEVSQE